MRLLQPLTAYNELIRHDYDPRCHRITRRGSSSKSVGAGLVVVEVDQPVFLFLSKTHSKNHNQKAADESKRRQNGVR